MARKLVHVLNGDGMSKAFQDSGIPCDELIIWREGLALGPVDIHLLNQENITRRKLFWETYSNIEENLPDYYKFALPELIKVASLENSTVFLWFEHDLFCQVNFLFATSLINQQADNHVFLVSTNSFPGIDKFKGFGQLGPDQLMEVFSKHSHRLSMDDIEFSLSVLNAYTQKSPIPLQSFLENDFPEHLTLLKSALKLHLERFPSVFNGLGSHEIDFLNRINGHQLTKNELIRGSLLSDSVYGFGDLEFFKILENLSDYIKYEDDLISLNDQGRKLINGVIDYWNDEHPPKWLGGTMISFKSNNIRWDEKSKKIIDNET